jgi:superfamily I DNA/RNA helicase
MSVEAVEGPAGSGKTHWLLSRLTETLLVEPLRDGQRVLALTYMHGARRRLHERLQKTSGVSGRFECSTIDRFASQLLSRWRGLANALQVPSMAEDEYEKRCDAAGFLLEQMVVAEWVAASFPIIVIDEAQDLSVERLRIVRALAAHSRIFAGADHYQCFAPELRPNPAIQWLNEVSRPTVLEVNRRTSVIELLTAAADLRQGRSLSIPKRGVFKVIPSKGTAPMAAAALANAIAWRRGGNVAVITPSMAEGGFSQKVVARVCSQPCGTQMNGPFAIAWESGQDDEVREMLARLELPDVATLQEALDALRRLPPTSPARATAEWVRLRARATNLVTVSAQSVRDELSRHVVLNRSFHARHEPRLVALSVHQAKNREFDGVVVLWPYAVGGDAEHKRRLLYNAVTRARNWCTVIPQREDLLTNPPFAS